MNLKNYFYILVIIAYSYRILGTPTNELQQKKSMAQKILKLIVENKYQEVFTILTKRQTISCKTQSKEEIILQIKNEIKNTESLKYALLQTRDTELPIVFDNFLEIYDQLPIDDQDIKKQLTYLNRRSKNFNAMFYQQLFSMFCVDVKTSKVNNIPDPDPIKNEINIRYASSVQKARELFYVSKEIEAAFECKLDILRKLEITLSSGLVSGKKGVKNRPQNIVVNA